MKTPSRPWLRRLLLAGAAAAAALIGTGLLAYQHLGRAPEDILDYVDRRLLGHPKLEALAWPALVSVRWALDAAPARVRGEQAFVVPAPPARRGAHQVPQPDPDPPGSRVWRVGPAGPIFKIADAARLARSGDIVEIEAGDYRGDVATWRQSRLTIRGVGGAARLYADGRNAEGKAIWVLSNGDFDISNIDFIGARVADGNGAAIRFEGGRLRLRHCLVWDHQMGLLVSSSRLSADAVLIVENSEFAYSFVPGRWGHNLYVGSIASLTVSGSYFHHAGVGHLLKSRARTNRILYNRFADESGGRASYELNFPNGGEVLLVGNIVEQQRRTENSVVVSYGEEGYVHPVNALYLGSNTLVNQHPYGGTFVRVAPGANWVVSANNLLVGVGDYRVSDPLTRFNDVHADADELVPTPNRGHCPKDANDRFLYRTSEDHRVPRSLTPTAHYVHPGSTAPLPSGPRFVGADRCPPIAAKDRQ